MGGKTLTAAYLDQAKHRVHPDTAKWHGALQRRKSRRCEQQSHSHYTGEVGMEAHLKTRLPAYTSRSDLLPLSLF